MCVNTEHDTGLGTRRSIDASRAASSSHAPTPAAGLDGDERLDWQSSPTPASEALREHTSARSKGQTGLGGLLVFFRWRSAAQRAGGRPSATVGYAEGAIRRSPPLTPHGRREYRNRGKGIAGSRPSGRSLSGNAIVARVARFGAGALLSLGDSDSPPEFAGPSSRSKHAHVVHRYGRRPKVGGSSILGLLLVLAERSSRRPRHRDCWRSSN
jgi:hypothetical protein